MIPAIHFILRTDRANINEGSAPIYMRIIFSRTSVLMRVLPNKKYIPLRKGCGKQVKEIMDLPASKRYKFYYWDEQAERATRGFGNAETINAYLVDEEKRVKDLMETLEKDGKLTKTTLEKVLLGEGNINTFKATFLDYCIREIDARKEVNSDETRRSYKSVFTKLNEYKSGVTLKEITYKFLVEYEDYMLRPQAEGGRGNNKRTVENNMKIIRTLILIAIKNKDLKRDNYPFSDYKVKSYSKILTTRDFLEPDEILTLENLIDKYVPISKPMKQMTVQDWKEREEQGIIKPGEFDALHRFLLAVYTGLRFKDILKLTYEENLRSRFVINPKTNEKKLRYFIEIDMHKTGVPVQIPLIEKALKLINLDGEGAIFDKIANNNMNDHLESIEKKLGIAKRITFHVARHSFGTIAFIYDIHEKVVQAVLGHQNRKFTEIYTHLAGTKLFSEMEKLNRGYNEYNLLKKGEENTNSKELDQILSGLQNLDADKLKKVAELVKLITS